MAENNEQYEEGQINGINDDIIDKKVKYRDSNNKIVYNLFALIIILIIGGDIFLLFSLKKMMKF